MMAMVELEELEGVGPAIAEKLRSAGYDSIESIAVATAGDLMEAAEIGLRVAMKVINSAREASKMGYEKALEVLERRKHLGRITTGSQLLDKIIGGGIETQGVTEFFGEFGSGKSQIAHQLCVNVQLPPEQGGLSGKAVYIDTENTFRPERISQMAMALGEDPQKILDGIYVARAHTTDHQMLLAEKAAEIAKNDGVRLLVIDSLTALFRTEYCGRGALAERQQKLGRHIAELHKLAELNDMAVFVTNQVQARPDVFFGDPTKPVGGHVLGHAVTARVYLRKGKANMRTAQLVDHPGLPPESATFQITEAGIRD
ncbi:MAG: DNA repair and recombination protein RadA [Candidatus Hadarchaeum yellowstonense]|jgi:DNA repair protein RadA|uniref:DNA repair and recombination protein RadA n=1 Tax=Hadarchaeum yellowstonense TaxID=1776334 RepID=A0A147JUH6_HADYE|nr:MAG: DNA repair and recombination protein RadA [Candidatus Hadarchaeum yellowstonense]